MYFCQPKVRYFLNRGVHSMKLHAHEALISMNGDRYYMLILEVPVDRQNGVNNVVQWP
jgi:hypothetical protein